MKKLILSASVAFSVLATTNVSAQQGFGTNAPDKSSAVDIVSSKRGLLIPRIDIADLDKAAPVSDPADALMVYNKGTKTAPGFYYWDAKFNNNTGRWVRFVSSNSGSAVTVTEGNNVTVEKTTNGHDTDYKVSVKGGDKDGKVLVTKIDGSNSTTVWVDPKEFVSNAVSATNGLTVVNDKDGNSQFELGGALTKDLTTIGTGNGKNLAITGLTDVSKDFKVDEQKIVVMGADGILKITSPKSLIEESIAKGNLDAKTLTTDGKIVIGDEKKSELLNSVLVDTKLSIKEGSITTTEIANGTIQNEDIQGKTIGVDKLDATGATAGHVATVNTDGTVSYNTITPAALTDKKTLTTDGVIVIGENGEAKETTATNSLLADVKLNIGKDKITADHIATGAVTSDEIADGTIQAVDMKSEGSSKVLVTNEKGEVIWTEQSALNNKDTFKGEGPIAINAGTDNTTGGKDYTISIANANGKDIAGVVKEADTAPTINFVNGVATVNVENISATQGKGLTSTSITVKDGANALLHAASIEITPGATDGMVLVTTGTDTKTTKWVPAGELGNTVTANNGLTKDDKNNITLGGTLTSPTEITSDKTNTLAIKGLQPATGANKVVVVNGEGVLATVNQSMSPTLINSTTNISNIEGYSPLTPEVVIEVEIGVSDINLELPKPSGAEGQTISVKIVNKDEPSAYLNIKANGTELTYGAMPFQGWIIKSNGTKWIIVGRN